MVAWRIRNVRGSEVSMGHRRVPLASSAPPVHRAVSRAVARSGSGGPALRASLPSVVPGVPSFLPPEYIMRLLHALFAGFHLALPSSAHGQVAEEGGDPLVGCYELQLGAWSPALGPYDAPLQTPPARFELRPEAGEGVFERGRTVARPVIDGGRTPNAFWERIGTDSVAVTWTDGHVGVMLRLEASDRPLQGVAVARTDAVEMGGPGPPRANAVARPVPCRPVRK